MNKQIEKEKENYELKLKELTNEKEKKIILMKKK